MISFFNAWFNHVRYVNIMLMLSGIVFNATQVMYEESISNASGMSVHDPY